MTCARCGRAIPSQVLKAPFLPDAETLHTSVFVGALERLLHWVCFEVEEAEQQTRMFT